MRSSKKIITGLVIMVTLLCLGSLLIESRTQFLRRMVDNYVYDNRNHYLPCGRLPEEAQVQEVVQQHRALIQAIEAVNPGLVGVEVDASTCPGRADLLIWYASHADRLAIQRLIGSSTFFGVPYRLQNR